MDAFADYSLDVRGFVHVRAALSPAELARAQACAAAGEPLHWLAATAAAASRVDAVCGPGSMPMVSKPIELDSPPVVLGTAAGGSFRGGGVRPGFGRIQRIVVSEIEAPNLSCSESHIMCVGQRWCKN
jgi:hypothetical protein